MVLVSGMQSGIWAILIKIPSFRPICTPSHPASTPSVPGLDIFAKKITCFPLDHHHTSPNSSHFDYLSAENNPLFVKPSPLHHHGHGTPRCRSTGSLQPHPHQKWYVVCIPLLYHFWLFWLAILITLRGAYRENENTEPRKTVDSVLIVLIVCW